MLALGAALGLAPTHAQDVRTSPLGYVEMPPSDDGTWVMTSPPGSGRNWGTPTFIRHLILVAKEWRRRHPEGPVLRLGDLSRPDGADFPPHKTHKDGLTADVFTSPKNLCHVDWDDQALTLELAQLFHDYGAKQILYNGELVCEKVPVAQKWPKHDDHFHVVIDPARVPQDGEVLVLPEPDSRDGAFISSARVDEERTGLVLSWRVLGQAKLRSYRVVFDDEQDGDVLHDSGPLKVARTSYAVPVALEHGKRYRWRLELDLGGTAPLGFGWQKLAADLQRPEVEATSPGDEAGVGEAPTLSWRYAKPGVAAATYRIELDLDSNHKKVSATLGPFPAATSYALRGVPLKKGKKYHWRVVVTDAHGNEGASAWRTFKVEKQPGAAEGPGAAAGGGREGPPARAGTVTTDALNLRAGPGTEHDVLATLRRGTPVTIRGESGDWFEVEAPGPSGEPARGFVSKRYVEVGAD